MLHRLAQFKMTREVSRQRRATRRQCSCREQRKRTWTCSWHRACVAALIGAGLLFMRGRHPPTKPQLAQGLFVAQVALAVALLRLRAGVRRPRHTHRRRSVSASSSSFFFLSAALFWGGFEQQATTFNTFALDYTDRSWLGGMVRRGHASGVVVPVDQPGLHHHFRAVLRVDLGGARRAQPGSFGAHSRWAWACMLLGVGFLVMMWARAARGFERRQGRSDAGCSWPI